MVSRSTLQIHNRVIDIDEGTWVHTIHSQSGAGSCEDSVRWLSSEPSQQHPPDCTSQSWPAAHLKHTNKITAADSFSPIDWFQLKKNSINKLVHRSNYVYPFIHTHTHTIEGVVSRMHLAELRHVLDWVTTGRGGAYAGLTGDASSLQSAQKTKSEKFTEWFYKNSIL